MAKIKTKVIKLPWEGKPLQIAAVFIFSLVLLQFLSFGAARLFDTAPLKTGAAFFMVFLAAATLLPFYFLERPNEFRQYIVIFTIVMVLDIFFLTYVAPRFVPDIFSVIDIKSTINAALGLP